MKTGSKAPFDGVLLSDAALARIKVDYEKQLELLKLTIEKLKREMSVERDTSKAVCKAEITAEQSKTDACNRDRQRQSEIYTKALDAKKCSSPIWNYLSFIGGAVVAGGICVSADRIK